MNSLALRRQNVYEAMNKRVGFAAVGYTGILHTAENFCSEEQNNDA